jgi:hypothetical protein
VATDVNVPWKIVSSVRQRISTKFTSSRASLTTILLPHCYSWTVRYIVVFLAPNDNNFYSQYSERQIFERPRRMIPRRTITTMQFVSQPIMQNKATHRTITERKLISNFVYVVKSLVDHDQGITSIPSVNTNPIRKVSMTVISYRFPPTGFLAPLTLITENSLRNSHPSVLPLSSGPSSSWYSHSSACRSHCTRGTYQPCKTPRRPQG